MATDVDVKAWSDPASIVQTNTDTTTLRNIDLFLYCNDRFREDSLTVRIAVRTPDSLLFKEAFRITIPRTATTPAALKREIAIPYRRNVSLLHRGNYRITITPERPVQGVEAVGISIVKNK